MMIIVETAVLLNNELTAEQNQIEITKLINDRDTMLQDLGHFPRFSVP
jgi:hypothetical protein